MRLRRSPANFSSHSRPPSSSPAARQQTRRWRSSSVSALIWRAGGWTQRAPVSLPSAGKRRTGALSANSAPLRTRRVDPMKVPRQLRGADGGHFGSTAGPPSPEKPAGHRRPPLRTAPVQLPSSAKPWPCSTGNVDRGPEAVRPGTLVVWPSWTSPSDSKTSRLAYSPMGSDRPRSTCWPSSPTVTPRPQMWGSSCRPAKARPSLGFSSRTGRSTRAWLSPT